MTFVQPDGRRSQPFYFFNRYDRETVAQTWQVLRSEFDQMLLDNAREKGAEVREETTVNGCSWTASSVVGVEATDKDGPHLRSARADHARLLRQGGLHLEPARLAHARSVSEQDRRLDLLQRLQARPGIDEGDTTVAYVPDKGWFWHIPQHNDMVSVGVVAEGKYLTRGGVKDPKAIFHREVEENLWIKDHLSRRRIRPANTSSPANTRRHSRYCAAPGLVLVGRRVCLSRSGLQQRRDARAEERHAGRRSRSRGPARTAISRPRASPSTAPPCAQGVENMRKLVYAFYDPKFSFREVIKRHPGSRRARSPTASPAT